MTPEVYATLARMRERLGRPARWAPGVPARDRQGWVCPAAALGACAWSLTGAATRDAPAPAVASAALRALLLLLPLDYPTLSAFEESPRTGHGDVVQLLDQALFLYRNRRPAAETPHD